MPIELFATLMEMLLSLFAYVLPVQAETMLYSYYYVAHCMIYLVLYDLSALVLLWHPLYNVIFWS